MTPPSRRRRWRRRVVVLAAAALLVVLPASGLLWPALPGRSGGATAGPADGPRPAPAPDPLVEDVPADQRPLLVVAPDAGGALTTSTVATSGDLPATVPETAVLLLHGYTSSAAGVADRLQAEALAAALDAVVVAPTGLGARTSWDAGGCCGSAARSGVDDVGFLRHLLVRLRARGAERAYVVGYSNGGMLAYRLACEHPDDVDAIAVVNGSITVPRCPGAFTALHLAGADDAAVPVDGAERVPYLFTGFPALEDLRTIAPAADLDLRVLPDVGHEVAPQVPATIRAWLRTAPTAPS
ncbi:alpha/beta fold hydrolase [Pseudokineococcus sp. 1T1Z-3]|uniref:alpha/beta fold hydrolase n=1 Tax=Pseudokineococcus sp. 1T1Z-3 TaxID=3132745 RepID=UPI0030A15FCC